MNNLQTILICVKCFENSYLRNGTAYLKDNAFAEVNISKKEKQAPEGTFSIDFYQ